MLASDDKENPCSQIVSDDGYSLHAESPIRYRRMNVRKASLSIIVMVLALSTSAQASILLDKVVAIIDREVITWSELYRAMSFEYESKTRGMGPEEKKNYFESQQESFLEKLITMRLLVAEAKKMGFSVSDAEAQAAISDIRSQYNLSEDQFREVLKREGFEYNDYAKRIQEQILINKIINVEVRNKIVVSDDEIDIYMDSHKDELPLDLIFKLAEIHFRKPGNVDERSEIQDLINQVSESVSGGGDFMTIAQSLKGNALVENVGENDFIRSSDLREDFIKTLKNTDEGKIALPIEANDGIFVFFIVKKELPVSLDVLKDNIRKIVLDKKSDISYRQWVKTLRQKAFIEIKL